MNKGEVLCAGLLMITLTKAIIEADKKQHINPNVANGKTLEEYNTILTLRESEENYRVYKIEQKKKQEEKEREERRQEKLKEQHRMEQAEKIRKEKEKSKKMKEVLFEVSFYHDGLLTASGVKPRLNHTIACPSEIPFGSIIEFEGKRYVCEDRGGYIKKVWSDKYNDYLYRVDVYVSSEKEAYKLGRYVVKGTIKSN